MSSVHQTAYRHTPDVTHGPWTPHPDMRWIMVKTIQCSECGTTVCVEKTDTFSGNLRELQNAEKRALQQMIDQGCKHITATSGMKPMDPADFSGGAKGKGKSHAAKGKK